jgi:hypothetical protein
VHIGKFSNNKHQNSNCVQEEPRISVVSGVRCNQVSATQKDKAKVKKHTRKKILENITSNKFHVKEKKLILVN